MIYTKDETADHLLKQIRFIRRHGTPAMQRNAQRWELIIRSHAQPADEPQAVNFAQAAEPQEAKP